jgi:hypothetical protein
VVFNGIKFDSKKEAKRYTELQILAKSNLISDLQLQVRIELIPTFKYRSETIRSLTYVADFVYTQNGNLIIEDVKSPMTRKLPTYINKIKLLKLKIVSEKLDWIFKEV